jgi:hypothetical protein
MWLWPNMTINDMWRLKSKPCWLPSMKASDPVTSRKKYIPWNYERPAVLMAFQMNVSSIFQGDFLCI